VGGGGGERVGGGEPGRAPPPPDLLTVAARAAVGLVALAVESAVQILRRVSGTPAGTPSDEDGLALVTGAAMGFTIEAVRTGLSIAQLGLRIAGPPTTFVVDTFLDAPRRAGEDLAGEWNERWREERPEVEAAATAVAVELVLDQLDLTELVLDHVDLGRVIDAVDIDTVVDKLDLDAIVQRVDLDRVAEGIDLDAVAERLDVERVVARLDLAKLSLEVIDRIDLPEIIRSSTGTVANEGVRVIRMQTFGADRAITGLVQRMLGRRPPAVAEEMAEEIAEDPERRGD
jgi:hypothetical protein